VFGATAPLPDEPSTAIAFVNFEKKINAPASRLSPFLRSSRLEGCPRFLLPWPVCSFFLEREGGIGERKSEKEKASSSKSKRASIAFVPFLCRGKAPRYLSFFRFLSAQGGEGERKRSERNAYRHLCFSSEKGERREKKKFFFFFARQMESERFLVSVDLQKSRLTIFFVFFFFPRRLSSSFSFRDGFLRLQGPFFRDLLASPALNDLTEAGSRERERGKENQRRQTNDEKNVVVVVSFVLSPSPTSALSSRFHPTSPPPNGALQLSRCSFVDRLASEDRKASKTLDRMTSVKRRCQLQRHTKNLTSLASPVPQLKPSTGRSHLVALGVRDCGRVAAGPSRRVGTGKGN
jgi:hypothetical protein